MSADHPPDGAQAYPATNPTNPLRPPRDLSLDKHTTRRVIHEKTPRRAPPQTARRHPPDKHTTRRAIHEKTPRSGPKQTTRDAKPYKLYTNLYTTRSKCNVTVDRL